MTGAATIAALVAMECLSRWYSTRSKTNQLGGLEYAYAISELASTQLQSFGSALGRPKRWRFLPALLVK
jgi:hypothetical protein